MLLSYSDTVVQVSLFMNFCMLRISPLTLLTLSETESLNFELANTVTGIVFDSGLSLLSNLDENKYKKVKKARKG